MPTGKHTIRLSAKGHLPETREIEVYENKKISMKLLPEPGPTADEVGNRQSTEKDELMTEEVSEDKPHFQTGIWEIENKSGKRSILYNVGSDDDAQEGEEIEQEKRDRAWEMLRNIIIDARERE